MRCRSGKARWRTQLQPPQAHTRERAAAALVPIGNVKFLAELSSFAALLAFLAVNLSLIIVRYRLPDLQRPFRVPLTIGWMPLLPLLAMASIGLLLANFDWEIYVAGIGALLLSGLAFLIRNWCRRAA